MRAINPGAICIDDKSINVNTGEETLQRISAISIAGHSDKIEAHAQISCIRWQKM